MQAASFPARQPRIQYRHELRTLTYVTLDDANGGIIRNLNSEGVAVQAVGPLRPHEKVRLRFELRFPRLRVEAQGEVSWATPTGQCGIRFVNLPARTGHQIGEWIFSNLLDSIARETGDASDLLGDVPVVSTADAEVAAHGNSWGELREVVRDEVRDEVHDEAANAAQAEKTAGLTLSPVARPIIRLEPSLVTRVAPPPASFPSDQNLENAIAGPEAQLNWLSRPLSGRALAWLVDGLVVFAGVLLFALIFLSIAHELPAWSLTAWVASAAAIFVAVAYWSVFAVFGGPSLGARLAESAQPPEEAERFR